MRTQLLCTFSKKEVLDDIIKLITNSYGIVFNRVYVLNNENQPKDAIITYNVNFEDNIDYNSVSNTISIHRKKQTNTLYTINALNELIKDLNNGVLDKKFEIPWENFENVLLVTNRDGLSKIGTSLFKIVEV